MGTARRDLRTSGDLVMAPRVPHGLAAAVEGLTREVIRHRPEDIYVFAAQHFEELLKLRDEYGAVTNLPGKSTNTAALREMNQSLKKRSGTEKSVANNTREKGGWSMNETARVLERHRSIFGDKGKKVSPEEVRALGNEKENKSRRRDDLERFANTASSQKRRGSNERFVRRRIPPKDPEPPDNKSNKSDSNGNPKIISQIPTLTQSTGLLAKDIKSELRKNRNSSRDGRSIRERAERKTLDRMERLDVAARQSGATKKTLPRSSHQRSLDKLIDVENDVGDIYGGKIGTDNQKQKTDASGWSKSFSKMPRTLSMDRVREYVVERFRGSESWEELRSSNYVDRVQEVIDEASPTILRRVKELSTRSAGRTRGYESVDESTSTSTRSDKSLQTDDVRSRSAMSASRRSRKFTRRSKSKSKSKTSGADSLEGIETLASETEQLKDNRNEIDTGKIKKGIPKNTANCLSGESDASDYTDVLRKASASSSISLPAVRPPSSKNHSRSVSRSDSDNLVLPPIPPEAPKSAKLREELVLPSLKIPKEVLRGVETSGGDPVLLEDTAEVELILPDAPTEEIFKDSLNVTPEVAASPRPDSLEPDHGAEQNDEIGDNIAELKSQLNEINSGNGSENISVADDTEVKGVEGNVGIKERLREIEETEKRIEKILRSESQESRGENLDAVSVKEKLIEIQEAEERLRNILDPSANVEENGDFEFEEIEKDVNDPGMKEKLIEIEETEKRIQKILDTEHQEIQKEVNDPGIKEKLIEIEETEKRIQKILVSDAREIQKDQIEDGMKEKLMEIEETEKRIEKILDPEGQGIQEEVKDIRIKENLMEIEQAEKRIEKILQSEAEETHKDEVQDDGIKEELIKVEESDKTIENPEEPQVQNDKTDDNFMKDELMEIEKAEKQLENVCNSSSANEEQSHNLDLKDLVGQPSHTSAPKTPFIPEIPSEYITTPNQVEGIDAATGNQFPEQSANPEDKNKEVAERNETKAQETEFKIDQFSSGTPDSLGNSYVLTEGSPYEIPDSVTTVIIPERQIETPASDVLEIVLEDDLGDGSRSFDIVSSKIEKSPDEESRQVSLRNILDNFGEIVHEEAAVESSTIDVDFIKNLKTSNDVVINKTDLGLITEENDKDFVETDVAEVAEDSVTPTLHDIAESEEILEVEEVRNSPKDKSHEPQDSDLESGFEIAKTEPEGDSGVPKTGSSGSLEPVEESEEAENLEGGNSLDPEDKDREFSDDQRTSGDRKKRSLETIEPEVTSPTITAIGSLQQNVTDSATTESTDEVKETTISDDGGNTAAESSANTPSCGEGIGTRNSESSNEVKETTISDHPAEEIGKNMFSLVPQCHGSMPHVPELNLDSLQDITVSSFQLSDDATAEEDSDGGQPQSGNDVSQTTATDEAHESQENQPVHEEIIIQEKVLVEEDPCTKVTTYVTEPNTESLELKTTELASMSVKEEADILEPEETGILKPKEDGAAKETQEMTEDVAEKVPGISGPEEIHDEIAKDEDKQVPEKEAAEIEEGMGKGENKKNISEEESENAHEDVVKIVPEEVVTNAHEELREEVCKDGEIHEDTAKHEAEEKHEVVPEDVANKVHGDKSEEIHEDIPEEETGKVPEEKIDDEAKKPLEVAAEEIPEEVVEDSAKKVSEGIHEELVGDSIEKEPEDKPDDATQKLAEAIPETAIKKEPDEVPEDVVSKSMISELDTVSLSDFKALEASVEEEYSKEDVEAEGNIESNSPVSEIGHTAVEEIDSTKNSTMRVLPEVGGSTQPEEINDRLISGKTDVPISANPDPPKAELATNDLHNDVNHGERTEYHIYVPEVTTSDDYSTTESSTFNSAATKIQAGVRGFLTRRRLQSAQRRSSTLDSVPSIQDSLATEGPHLEPIEEVGLAQAATTIQSNYRGYKARQRLRREDAVQKTTMSVENAFCANGLQHTGEFHDCLPLLPPHSDEEDSPEYQQPRSQGDLEPESEEKDELDTNTSQENREWVTESTATKEESGDDESTLGLLLEKSPYAHQGLSLVVLSGNDAVLQSQYLNFITSIEEVPDEIDSLNPGSDASKIIDGFPTMKSNAGIESLPLDNPETDSISVREPLAVPGSPTGLVIEELSKTDEEISLPADMTSISSTNYVKTGINGNNESVSEVVDDSLDLPGLSLERHPEVGDDRVAVAGGNDCLEIGKSNDGAEETGNVAQDASLETMSFSINVDDMLGLGGESDPAVPSKMKPILEVTVTPRDLLKLTNRSEGSRASGDRVESPVTMMQIVPKSEEKSEDERDDHVRKIDETNHPINEIPEDDVVAKESTKTSSNEDDESSDKTSKTFSIGKN